MSDSFEPAAWAAILAAAALLGRLGWRLWRTAEPRLGEQDLSQRGSSVHGLWLFPLGMLLMTTVAVELLAGMGEAEDLPLESLLMRQTATMGIAAVAVLVLASRLPGGAGALGWRPQDGPSFWLVGSSVWLAFLPVLALVTAMNASLLHLIGQPIELQPILEKFMAEPGARSSVAVWSSTVGVLPICEEILYRGALYGGLRRVAPVPLAAALSAAAFGMGHPPAAMLPTAALGVVLALIYERTGSLAAPCVLHGMHNGVTLALAASLS